MKNALILFILILSSFKSFSWSKEGHEIVAQVAKQYLTKPLIDSIQKYLDTLSFEEAANWMDNVRSNHDFDYLKPWHYVNIPKDATFVQTDKPNLINQLQFAIDNLKNRKKLTPSEIGFNLRIIFHLVGDLHQPLHCGYFDDKGGNDKKLLYLGKEDNLHHVWDKSLIATNKINSDSCLALIKTYSEADIKKIQKIDILSWVNESRTYLPFVYDYDGHDINVTYVLKSDPIIKKQLSYAGIRLAGILQQVFSKSN